MKPIRVALVGIGKIAESEHLPALAQEPHFELAALVSRSRKEGDAPWFATVEEALDAVPDLDAVSLAAPPVPRYEQALTAIRRGKHVMLEKPPGATVTEVEMLAEKAARAGVTLYASWHSREGPAVQPAREWLSGREVQSVEIVWRENVRQWHPGQDWLFEPGGMGVFDPAINAFSILTEILPGRFAVRDAKLTIPLGRQAPLSARMRMENLDRAEVTAELDFLFPGEPQWDIVVQSGSDTLKLEERGWRMAINGDAVPVPAEEEYRRLYRRFADLIGQGRSDVDSSPLQLVADAMMIGERREGQPFDW